MNNREVSLLRFRYPIGSNNDPLYKEGITHFMEHCLLKAKVNDENLIEICQRYGATIKASTSLTELKIEITVLNHLVIELLNEYNNFLLYLYNGIKLDAFFMSNEKAVIIKEMETKNLNFNMQTGNKILGNSTSVAQITTTDVKELLRIFIKLRPIIEVSQISKNDRNQVERIINNITTDKFICLDDDKISEIYLLLNLMICETSQQNAPEFFYLGKKRYIKCIDDSIDFIYSNTNKQLIDYINNNYHKNYHYGKFLSKLSIKEFNVLLKQLMVSLEKVTNIAISEVDREKINIIKLDKINNINYCVIKTINYKPFISVAISISNLKVGNIQSLSESLGSYLLKNQSGIDIKVNFEIGVINLYISGLESELLFTLKLLLSIGEKGLSNFVESPRKPVHILEKIHIDILNLRMKSNDSLVSPGNIIIERLSVVSNISDFSKLERILAEEKDIKPISIINNQKNLLIKLNKYSSENEYIKVWEGPSYFSKEKYLSHLLWILLDGTTGGLYKKFSLENSYFYSYKYFPREFYDYGYCVLYVYTKNKEYKGIINNLFINLLKELSTELSDNDFELAKEKLMLAKINSKNQQVFINLASHILFKSDIDSFFYYEEIIKSIKKIELMDYIRKVIDRDSILLT